MARKFKVGDMVRAIEYINGEGHDPHILTGEVHEVARLHSAESDVYLAGRAWSVDCSRFELAAPKVRQLKGDVKYVFERLVDGQQHPVSDLLEYITRNTGKVKTDATVTARIRDLRKAEFGGFDIRRTQQGKQHFYQLVQV